MGDAKGESYFEVAVDKTAGPARVTASGELDAAASPTLDRALQEALDARSGVALDMGEVTFIDSSALRVITLAVQRAQEDTQVLTISPVSDSVRRIFDITGIGSLLSARPPSPTELDERGG